MENAAAIRPDILGEPWVSRILPLTPSRQAPGADFAVLVHQRAAESGRHSRAVLHVPGFVDYFFHTHHAAAWLDAGVEYYALDQRGQGRASVGVPALEDIRDLTVREEDLRAAVAAIREHGHTHVTLLGHSTGGLQAAVFADAYGGGAPLGGGVPLGGAGQPAGGERLGGGVPLGGAGQPAAIDALILNSPWLQPNRPTWVVAPSLALVRVLAPIAPRLPINVLGPAYPRFLHRHYGGEWDFDPRFKVLDSFPARAGFLRAVLSLQERVRHGLDIRVPTLVAVSDRAGHPTRPTPEDLASSDVVLNPAHIRALAPKLGRAVEVQEFPGGIHDLALSPSPVREQYTAAIIAWALAH